MMVGK